MSKILYILIGLPASGKSTWRENFNPDDYQILSTDDMVEAHAREMQCTYNEAFPKVIDDCNANFNVLFHRGLDAGISIVIDRTNVTAKGRSNYINAAIRKGYRIEAIEFARPMTDGAHAEWNRRLDSRPGKVIPPAVLQDMFRSWSSASTVEGFNAIYRIDTFEGL